MICFYNIINGNYYYYYYINDWICTDNPSLDYKERLRRRIILQAHVERLGYPVFEAKNYVKQMFSQWAQVSALKNTIKEPELIGSLNYWGKHECKNNCRCKNTWR